jgi:hypothetical protein
MCRRDTERDRERQRAKRQTNPPTCTPPLFLAGSYERSGTRLVGRESVCGGRVTQRVSPEERAERASTVWCGVVGRRASGE